MDNHHHHHHHHHVPAVRSISGVLIFSTVLNLSYVVVEAGVGLLEGSLSLLSDAGHNLSDVCSLLLVLMGLRLAAAPATPRYTYGYRKSTVLISLLNAILLLMAVGAIAVECIRKLNEPQAVDGEAVTWTALVGILVNGATALLLLRGQRGDLNVRGAFLHMVADTLVSVGVVAGGIAISLTGQTIIDPIVSLIVVAVILGSTWRLLRDSLRLAIDGTPEGVSVEQLTKAMEQVEQVKEVHHVHVWAISTTENALTAHVVVTEPANMVEVKHRLRQLAAEAGVSHCTLEVELPGEDCGCTHCEGESAKKS